jgi:hypothetical protein
VFSTGVRLADRVYPEGAELEVNLSLFGKIPVLGLKGFVNPKQMSAQLTGIISRFSLGPVSVSGFDPNTDASVRAQSSALPCTHTDGTALEWA